MAKEYKSGMFCTDIKCAHHKSLEELSGDVYIAKKKEYCKDCYAWKFLIWLNEKGWKILFTTPEMTSKELAAHLKGLDPSKMGDLSIEEILCL